jgi:hypothetical protein
LETIEFKPVGQQTTNIIKIFGDPQYTVDLSRDDLFVKVIALRTTVKADRAPKVPRSMTGLMLCSLL